MPAAEGPYATNDGVGITRLAIPDTPVRPEATIFGTGSVITPVESPADIRSVGITSDALPTEPVIPLAENDRVGSVNTPL
jgi:hypothetical protein